MAKSANRSLVVRAIFISYRRDDAEGEAGRLFDDLVKDFGEASVFMDVAGIQAGRDFRKVIDETVATCGVLLAIIGRNWLDAKNEAGERRLDNPADFVRLETASALKRDIPVIPVLVHGARMPRPDQLPDDLKDLAYRNCCELTHARWGSDLSLLIKALRDHLDPKSPPDVPRKAVEDRAPAPPPPSPARQEREIDRTPARLSNWTSHRTIAAVLTAAVVIVLVVIMLRAPKAAVQEAQVDKPVQVCMPGFVRRFAYPHDPVCVTPAVHEEALQDNRLAASRRARDAPPGSDICAQGFVWREAIPTDHVCVVPSTRTQTAQDNQLAPSRIERR